VKALRWHARGDVRLDDVDEPVAGPGEITVEVAAAGICGSDIHEYRGGPIAVPVDADHPLTGQRAPVTLGHELAGTVVAVGEGVRDIGVGDRVAASAVLRCGTCRTCAAGLPQLCATLGFHGLSGGGGGFAPLDTFPAYLAHRLPDAVDTETGALLEPLATGVHAVARSGIGPGDTVLVAGAGPIGLMTVVAARARGAATALAAEPAPARARAATALGADAVLDPLTEDVGERVRELTGGTGVDAAFDAAAAPASFDTVLAAVRPRGTVVNVAAWEQPVAFHPNLLLFGEPTVTGALAYTPEDFAEAVRIAASGTVDLGGLVTRRIRLADAVTDGFARLAAAPGDDIKVLVVP
jgi:(R,R)-butanediol dehydrogenase/meso-butanediol dehydrogenase/diacetyl reductase